MFGSEQVRMVRVGYELVPDKQHSKGQRQVYSLVRKQTPELKNTSFKQDENVKQQAVVKHVVAQYIKHLSLQATYVPQPKKEKGEISSEKKKPDPVKTFVWTEKQEKASSTGLPEYINMHIELWDTQFEKAYSFECLIPCFVRDEMEQLDDKKNVKKAQEQPKDSKKPEQTGDAQQNVEKEE